MYGEAHMSIAAKPAAEGIDSLLLVDKEYASPIVVSADAYQKNWSYECSRALEFPDAFWGDYARTFTWSKPWEKVYEFDGIHHQWFRGAKLNITVNALDRHANSERRNRVAYIWLGEDGTERQVTYGQLHAQVCRFANGLKSLGLQKGDRVIIYMPLTLEGVISMLACARIGVVHSVVYAGLGHTALRDRIVDAQAKVVITGDVGYRRGKIVQLKSITDEAVDGLEFVEKVVVFSRENTALTPHEVNFTDLMKFPNNCEAVEMDAEDPLFILYTSGSTGKPKGVVHVHGGYMVGITYHLQNYYDVSERDIFWCTSDIGWIVGHSYIVYGPLCAGVTTMFREGAIDFPAPDIAWDIVERYRVSKMFTAPTALRMFMREPSAEARHHQPARGRMRGGTAESGSMEMGADLHRRRRQVGLRGG
jgi:acetyl-CoA synthetase